MGECLCQFVCFIQENGRMEKGEESRGCVLMNYYLPNVMHVRHFHQAVAFLYDVLRLLSLLLCLLRRLQVGVVAPVGLRWG